MNHWRATVSDLAAIVESLASIAWILLALVVQTQEGIAASTGYWAVGLLWMTVSQLRAIRDAQRAQRAQG